MGDDINGTLICRGCMKTDGLLLSMYDDGISEKQLPEKLAIVASIEVDKNDDLPNYLCTKCAYRTDAFYNFKLQVQKSEQKLRLMLNMQENLMEKVNEVNIKTEEITIPEFCQYNSETKLDDIIPDILINTNNIPKIQGSLIDEKIDHIDFKEIEHNIDSENRNQFLFFHDKFDEIVNSPTENCIYLACISNESKEVVLNNDKIPEIGIHTGDITENNDDIEENGKKIIDVEIEENNKEHDEDDIDSDSDNCVASSDNLLGTLNDTIVKIKELKSDVGKLQYQCTLCMHNYDDLREILNHTIDNHIPKSGPFYCVVCEKDCNNQKELRLHIKTHIGPNPYTCFICDKSYSMKRYLKRHMTCHSDFARYRCSKCGKRFKIKAELESHCKIHVDGAPFTCNQCNRAFNYKAAYKRHLMTHLDPKGLSLPKYPCCVCRKRFVNNRTLQIHMRVHTGEKPFQCHICERSFSQQGNLLNHVKIHSDPRRYTCDVCGKKFNQRSTLRDHSLLHTGEKPYVCNVCGLAFTFGAALRRHMWTHSDDKPLGCDICNARFVGKYDLKRHMSIHWNKSKSKRRKNKITESNDHDITEEPCQLHDDVLLTQVATVPETIFIDHVLIDHSKNQIVITQEDAEKENVDALFNFIEYT